ncbi:TetR family transcriptional regulator [Bradyrhizobium lablabi]|uniref:TetR/AcrR family transcriptional regulator n=1 Tax=Bradyrhizobium lablabi TaxID=722472 RepID=UPI001BAA5F2A|nr:TetR/AcrR family transcriptional regulator [Bradyrhizobium lablabi]MBR1125690.1 TetR family transcriptional regulator [Bradyrhizobium lablabi]
MGLGIKKRTIVERLTAESSMNSGGVVRNLADLFNRRIESPSIRRILLAAVDSFSKTGFHAASTRDIARKAKLSPAAVYVHFHSKEELLYTVVTLMSEWVFDQVSAAARERGRPAERLRRVVQVHVASHAAMRTAMFVSNFEFHSLNAAQRKKILRYRDAIEKLFEDCIRAGCEDGSFHAADIGITKVAVVSLCVSVLNWFSPGGRLSPEQVGDYYADLVLSMLRADPT